MLKSSDKRFLQSILFDYCANLNGELYFWTRRDGFLMCMNIDGAGELSLKYVPKINEGILGMSSIENRVLVLYDDGKTVGEYDTYDKSYRKCSLGSGLDIGKEVIDYFAYGDNFIVIPRQKEHVCFLNKDYSVVDKIEIGSLGTGVVNRGTRYKDKYYLLRSSGNKIYEVDLVSRTVKGYELKQEISDIVSCHSKKGNIYIISRDGGVYQWNIVNKELTTVFTGNICTSFFRMITCDERIIILPHLQNDPVMYLDCATKQCTKYDDYPEDFEYLNLDELRRSAYDKYIETDEKYVFAMRTTSHLLEIDKKTGDMKWKRPYLKNPQEVLNKRFERFGGIVDESNTGILDFIDYVNGI